MKSTWSQAIVTVWFYVVLWIAIVSWAQGVRRFYSGLDLVPLERRRPVPWTLLTLILAALFTVIVLVSSEILLKIDLEKGLQALPATSQFWLTIAGSAVSALSVLVIAVGMRYIAHANGRDLGFRVRRWTYDTRLGLLFFAAIVPIVYLMQYLLRPHFDKQHPLIDMLSQSDSLWVDVAAFVLAVVLAPVAEEFVFRVLLQGWLQTIVRNVRVRRSLRESLAEEATIVRATSEFYRPVYGLDWMLPIFISSLIFALGHSSHGSAPYPLFVFACGLGHLYYATHRIWPCIVMHAGLNATSMMVLFASR